MAEAKLAPNLPDWMVKHANRYLASDGAKGHVHKRNLPGLGEITVPALLLTTTAASPARSSYSRCITVRTATATS
jgi:proline iminopeptidase